MVIIQTNMIIIVINKRYLINKIDETNELPLLISLISIPSYQGMSRFGKHTSQRLFMKRKEIFT